MPLAMKPEMKLMIMGPNSVHKSWRDNAESIPKLQTNGSAGDKAQVGFTLLAVRVSVVACHPIFALATPLECSSISNLALRLAWSRSNILPVSSVTLVLTLVLGVATAVSIDIATMCTAIATSTATVVTTIVAVVYIGIHLALVGTFSCTVSRFATSVAISRLGAGWLSAHHGLKQGIDLSACVCPVSRSNGLEGGRRRS